MRRTENTEMIALALVFETLARLEFWPGDPVRAYDGPPCRYVRLLPSGYHLIQVEENGVEQVAPLDSVRRRGPV